MIRFYYTKIATVYRLAKDSGDTKKESYPETSIGTVNGALLSIQPTDMMLSDGNPSQSSSWYCDPSSDIKKLDRLIIDGDSYIVRGVSKTSVATMSINYMKCIIEKQDS